jgi:uncharacterized repeat protein (TIGR01451 family)
MKRFKHILASGISLVLSFVMLGLAVGTLAEIAIAAPTPATISRSLPGGPETITATKSASPTGEVGAGETLMYTITFEANTLVDTATVTDKIPAFTQYVPGTISGTPSQSVTNGVSGTLLSWDLTGIPTNTEVIATFAVRVANPISDDLKIVNTAWVSGEKVSYTNTVASSPAFTLTKVGPTTALSGGLVHYTIRYTNTGTMTGTDVIISDTLPAGMNFVSSIPATSSQAGSAVGWLLPELPPNEPGQVTLTATVTKTGLLTNYVEIGSAEGVTYSTAAAPVMVYNPILTLTKVATPTSVRVGRQVTYEYRVENIGDTPFYTVTLTDDKIQGTRLISIPVLLTQTESITQFLYTPTFEDLGTITNTAIVTGYFADQPYTATKTITVSVQPGVVYLPLIYKVLLQLTVTATPSGEANLGQAVAFNYTIQSGAPLTEAKLVVVTETYDPQNNKNTTTTTEELGALTAGAKEVTAQYTVTRNDLIELKRTVTVEAKAGSKPVSAKAEVVVPIPTTKLSINSQNTGGVIPFEVREQSTNNLIASCTIGDNVTQFCANFHPGTYKVTVYPKKCGSVVVIKTYTSGPATTSVKCN